jgi:hypothetical protein
VLFELSNDVAGHRKPLIFGQRQFETAHDLGGAAQRKRNLVRTCGAYWYCSAGRLLTGWSLVRICLAL